MKAAIKKMWVKALRSGRYRQARGRLKHGQAMCCLGVLCEIQGADWRVVKEEMGGLVTSNVPRKLNAGLREAQRMRLASMNDGTLDPFRMTHERKHSFKEIADYIEAKL